MTDFLPVECKCAQFLITHVLACCGPFMGSGHGQKLVDYIAVM